MMPVRRWNATLALVCTLFSGCAQERIRDDSQQSMREGRFEQAVQALQDGLKQHPESPLLRGALLQTRSEALARLLAEAANARAAGRLDETESLLQRAATFEVTGGRAANLLVEIAAERRQLTAIAEAESLIQANKPQAALRVLAEALKDNPRQPALLKLQRRLESEARRSQIRAVQAGLTETRPISLDFRDASLRTVLDLVTRHSGINFILDKDIRQDTRITVLLRSARVEDAIDLIVSTHQLAKKVVDPQTILVYPNTPDKQREHQEQVVRVFHLDSADAKGAAAFLRSMLRVKEPYVDERTNMVSIRESAETVELAEKLIALYDIGDAEVLLELEVIEISKSRLLDLGIRFPDTLNLTPLPPSGANGLTLGNIRGLNADRIGLGVAGLILNLKREVGDVNTLANPRIRARNKEKAKVLIGDKIPIITATTGQTGFVSESVSYIDVGLKLDVEPTVYPDDEVAIRVNLEVSSLGAPVKTASGSAAYQIGTRSASTMLRLRDGETQLLAGLISNEERSNSSRVPGLGDLPLAGRLFSQTQDQASRTELMLAITPRILRNVRRPEASEAELWVGTEAVPRLRNVGGLLPERLAATAPPSNVSPSSLTAPPAVQAGSYASPALPAEGQAVLPTPSRIDLHWQPPGEVRVGEIFAVKLELNSNVALRGAPVQLRYDPTQLQMVDIEEGEYFKRAGTQTSFTKGIEAQQGTARAGVLRNQATGAQGQDLFLTVRMKALVAGSSDLHVTAMQPIGLLGGLPPVALPVSVQVHAK